MARAGSKKTRTGCLTCRSRKVKCDETKPVCRNCGRLGLRCEYATISTPTTNTRQSNRKAERRLEAPSNPISCVSSPDGFVTPVAFSHTTRSNSQSNSIVQEDTSNAQREYEIDRRRNHEMELQVLHAWMSRGVLSTPAVPEVSEWISLWFIRIPSLAFQHRHLLYALLAFAAVQKLGSADHNREMAIFQAEYWEMALQRQRLALMAPTRHVESLSIAAYIISMTALGVLRGRELEPYNPPTSWLDITRMSNKLGVDEDDKVDDTNVASRIIDLTSGIIEEMKIAASSKSAIDDEYSQILSFRLDEEQVQYPGVLLSDLLRPYEQTLSLVSAFKSAILSNKPAFSHVRRICIIPHFLPSEFIIWLGQRRPRALLVLAVLFSVILRSNATRFLGDEENTIARREIQAVADNLPTEWQHLVQKPLKYCHIATQSPES